MMEPARVKAAAKPPTIRIAKKQLSIVLMSSQLCTVRWKQILLITEEPRYIEPLYNEDPSITIFFSPVIVQCMENCTVLLLDGIVRYLSVLRGNRGHVGNEARHRRVWRVTSEHP